MKLPDLPRVQGVFVTGTDTEVGKTWIAAGLTMVWHRWGRSAVYFKPVQSGCPEEAGKLVPTDARLAQELAGLREPLELLTPITLRLPLAPGVAAAREGTLIDLAAVAGAFRDLAARYEIVVVEGAGGLYVPVIGIRFLMLDLMRWLKLPLVVVARPGLGTVNHTALTVLAARQAGLSVAGVIINRYPARPSLADESNPEVNAGITGTPILGKVPEVDLTDPGGRQTFLAAMEEVCRNLSQAGAARAFLQCMI
jgi:dethiobiotin synthetase